MPGKILIADDQNSTRFLLRGLLEKEFYTVQEAKNGQEAVDIAFRDIPDLILLDIEMPVMNGFEACKILKSDPRTLKIPIIMITAHQSQADRNSGLFAGADDYLNRPLNARVLSARLQNLIRVKQLTDELELRIATLKSGFDIFSEDMPDLRKSKILIASELDADITDKFQTQHIPSEEAALKEMHHAEAIIIAEVLPCGGSGLRLIAHIRAAWELRNKVIIFIANDNEESGLRALELGANDYLMINADIHELRIRINTQLKRKLYADKLRDLVEESLRNSVIDPLTSLHNRRYFNVYLPNLISRSERESSAITFMMVDLDHFKAVNDEYGHDAGDAVLVETAERLRSCFRASDLVVRWGGEEFIIVIPKIPAHMSRILAERVRIVIEETPFTLLNGETIRVTTSIGANHISASKLDLSKAISQADEALYQAKREGRNRVIFIET